jgi:hypothetical protein
VGSAAAEAMAADVEQAEKPSALGRAWILVSLAMLGVIAVAGTLFFWHRARTLAELDEHFARSAARQAREIELKYASHRQVFENLTKDAFRRGREAGGDESARLEQVIARSPRSHRDSVERCRGSPDRASEDVCIVREVARDTGVASKELEFAACAPAGLRERSAPLLDVNGTTLVLPPADGSFGVCGHVALNELLAVAKQSPGRTEKEEAELRSFGEVLLLRRDGSVLDTADRSGLRVSVLPGEAAKNISASRILRDIALGPTRYRAYLQPLTLRASDAAPGMQSAASSELVLCGLVREDWLERESRGMRPGYFLWALVLLAGGVLALPLAKLWLLGPKSRLTRFDVALLIWSAVISTVVTTLLGLGIAAYDRLFSRLDEQLQSVAGAIGARLTADLAESADVLDKYVERSAPLERALTDGILDRTELEGFASACAAPDERAVAAGAACRMVLSRVPRLADCAGAAPGTLGCDQQAMLNDAGYAWPLCEQLDCPDPAGALPARAPGRSASFRERWSSSFITNAAGYQWVKSVPQGHSPQPISVAERQYFQLAKAGLERCLAGTGGACSARGVPEVVRSATRGELTLIVARSLRDRGLARRESHGLLGVAAVGVRLPEFRELLLPLGFQMAVIDPNGTVMLHSDVEANHGQNFFDDVADLVELRAAMAAAGSSPLDLRYRGSENRARLLHLPGPDWYLLVLAPLSLLDAVSAHTVLITLIGCVLLFVATLIVAVPVLAVRRFLKVRKGPRREATRLRPDVRLTRAYADAGVWLLALAVPLCAAFVWLGPRLPTTLALLGLGFVVLPALVHVPGIGRTWPLTFLRRRFGLALGRFSARVRRGGEHGGADASAPPPPRAELAGRERWRDDLSLTYSVCCFGLLALLVVAPTTVIFLGAHEHVVTSLIQAEQSHFALRQADPRCLIGGTALTRIPEGARPPRCDGIFASGQEHAAPAERLSVPAAPWLRPVRWLVEHLPPLEPYAREPSGRHYTRFASSLPSGAPPLVPGASRSVPSNRSSGDVPFWSRTEREIVCEPGGKLAFASSLPSIGWPRQFVFRAAAVALAFAAFIGLVAAHRSIRRLLLLPVFVQNRKRSRKRPSKLAARDSAPPSLRSFARYVEEAGSEPDQALRALWKVLGERKAVVVFATPPFVRALRAAGDSLSLMETRHRASSSGAVKLVENLEVLLGKREAIAAIRAAGERVVLLSPVDPLRRAPPELRSEWVLLLSDFEWFILPPPGDVLVRRVDRTPAAFERAWQDSDPDEKRVLAQLAIDGYTNPHPENVPVLEHLIGRGLVSPHHLDIANEAFARHIARVTPPSELTRLQSAEGPSAWQTLRVPLFTGLALLLTALGTSEPALAAAGIMAPALAAGLPVVIRVLLRVAGTAGSK